jgi:hypothetical protein
LIYICMVSSIFVVAVAVVAVERSAFSSMPDGLPGDYHAIPTIPALCLTRLEFSLRDPLPFLVSLTGLGARRPFWSLRTVTHTVHVW